MDKYGCKTCHNRFVLDTPYNRITTSFKIDKTIKDKFKIYCIEKGLNMSDILEKLIEK